MKYTLNINRKIKLKNGKSYNYYNNYYNNVNPSHGRSWFCLVPAPVTRYRLLYYPLHNTKYFCLFNSDGKGSLTISYRRCSPQKTNKQNYLLVSFISRLYLLSDQSHPSRHDPNNGKPKRNLQRSTQN